MPPAKLIDELPLKRGVKKCLAQAGIIRISQLTEKTEPELLRTKNFGRKGLRRIKTLLAERGLSLRLVHMPTYSELAALPLNERLFQPLAALLFSARTDRYLEGAGIQTIGELVQKTEADLLKIKNFGPQSLREVKEVLGLIGLSFGMASEQSGGWPNTSKGE